MGLIKLAVIGGAAYYAVKGFKGDREARCRRGRPNNQEQYPHEGARQINDEKPYESRMPPSYAADENQAYHSYPTYDTNNTGHGNEKRLPSPQQMIFTAPKRAYNIKDMVPYNSTTTTTTTQKEKKSDDLVDQAMQHLNSGNQEKAREILAGAITSNRMH